MNQDFKDKNSNSVPLFRQAWLLSFGDLLTLMLCFFIALCSFQKFSPSADQELSSGNHKRNYEISEVDKSDLNIGTPFAATNLKGSLPGLTFSSSELSGTEEFIEDQIRERLASFIQKVQAAELSLSVETCSRVAQDDVEAWVDALRSTAFLEQQILAVGVNPSELRARVLGPHCGLLLGEPKDVVAVLSAY